MENQDPADLKESKDHQERMENLDKEGFKDLPVPVDSLVTRDHQVNQDKVHKVNVDLKV
jgi:hypothetical protein